MYRRLFSFSALALLAATGCTAPALAYQVTPSGTLRSYHNGKDGYSMAFPTSWSVSEDAAAGFSVAAASPDHRFNVNVLVQPMPAPLNAITKARQHAAAFVDMLVQQAPCIEAELLESRDRPLSGYHGTFFRLRLHYPGDMLEDRVLFQYALTRNGQRYLVTATAPSEVAPTAEPALQTILASFRFHP